MPNQCGNNLYVSGDPAQLARFMENARAGDLPLCLHRIAPMPAELELTSIHQQTKEESERLFNAHGAADQHNWRMLHWGTGQEPRHVHVEMKEDGSAVYHFPTAWTPVGPPLLRTITGDYPGLRAEVRYGEPFNCCSGRTVSRDGWITEESREYYDPIEEPDDGKDQE